MAEASAGDEAVMRALPFAVLAVLIGASAMASPERAVPGAGWSPVPVTGKGGEATYRRYCWECHGEGKDRPGTDALRVKYQGSLPALLHERTDLSAEFVIDTVRHGVSVMPAARKTEISDTELKAIATYLTRTSR